MNTQRYISALIFCLVFSIATGQSNGKEPRTVSELPRVFIIGENEKLYANLYEQYPGILLHQTNNDMNQAFKKWLSMLYAMEEHADKIEYDIKGLKVWLQVFFNQSGKIDYLLFHKKPLSRNIDNQELIAFFRTFIRDFQLSIEAKENFNHSGSGSFPTYGHSPLKARKDDDQ